MTTTAERTCTICSHRLNGMGPNAEVCTPKCRRERWQRREDARVTLSPAASAVLAVLTREWRTADALAGAAGCAGAPAAEEALEELSRGYLAQRRESDGGTLWRGVREWHRKADA